MDKFNFYCGYYELCEKLSARQFRKLMKALCDYAEKKGKRIFDLSKKISLWESPQSGFRLFDRKDG